MYSYSPEEWMIFFLIYSFIGWIYEEIFYLFADKKLVNRGFMHGPFLPIYGVGAIIILLAVLPVGTNPVLVFLIGGLAATILELLTGMAMEAMFHVRYWDYTGCFLNYNGHICFRATLVWCIASVLLVNCVHVPLGNFLKSMNTTVVYAVAHLFSLGFTADFAISFREALDLRQILDTLMADNEEFAKIAAELNAKKEDIEAAVREFEAKREKLEADISDMRDKAEYEIERRKFNAESDMEQLKMKAEVKADSFRKEAEEELMRISEHIEAQKAELRSRLHSYKRTSGYKKIKLIMNRNTIVSSERYKKALEQLKEMIEKH